jgi:hypothetical protein
MVKRVAKAAGINEAVSPHLLRHAHGSRAIERSASLPEVQATLGHRNISTTSGYLHARADGSSGLRLDPGGVSSMKRGLVNADLIVINDGFSDDLILCQPQTDDRRQKAKTCPRVNIGRIEPTRSALLLNVWKT